MSYPSEPELGWYYVVSVAGDVGEIHYEVGDWIVWNGTTWDKLIGKSDVMPIGAVIMYDGTGIANVATREVELGDEGGDTFAMPGWFVCNGLAGTPNLEKMFVRGGLVSGVVEGSDDVVVVEHNHGGLVADGGVHTPVMSVGPAGTGANRVMSGEVGGGSWSTDYFQTVTAHNHDLTIENEGVSGVGKNVPVHYVVIYIKKMS